MKRFLLITGLLPSLTFAQGNVRTFCTLYDVNGSVVYGEGKLIANKGTCSARVTKGFRVYFTYQSTGFIYNCAGTEPSEWSEVIQSNGQATLTCYR